MNKPANTMINGFDPARLASLPERERTLIERRQAVLGPSYRLFYENPLHLVRGEGVWLYDADGNAYLDAYNNVPSVGHCHPRVVAAMSQQAAVLNTHTRYLDEKILDYCDKLLATFPDELSRVMFTCTGSEAVDLALRLARYYTGGTGIIITDNAYHGVTAAAAEISPSLGPNMPLGVHVVTVPAPDAYRAGGQDVETAFADGVAKAIAFLRRHGIKPAAFIADSIFSTDGIFSEPAGFLKKTLEIVHEAGALHIADEVQPGFGRLGSHMWGFLRHGIVPDIVVMGKPMGNGLPIAAAVMKAEVQDRFGRDIRYFNTFGANHVSIAAANAVLDIIRDEDLMGNALSTGDHMLAGMRQLQQSFDCIGDVRGAGLFLGLEFVKDRQSREPDGGLALAVVNRMRDRKVLISAAGIHGNTLKIRPPLPFGKEHADIFLDTLEEVLRAMH
ncbi:aspartate aminotransferase family protein [Rhizobium sp. CG5]|uniref:aspartate aminotransferase family protein n=1 Tax=Rhizobium sp. CG5 TaxID=2726076 RepID=UPI0020336506|nr:aspartate aminotransferase family protein [Rhizobium sp. CG5]MCM2472320.1 aspartate aminotransferase family protein [Rhizobium sp. CG5]